jgi:AcrR family transcriptional regulator
MGEDTAQNHETRERLLDCACEVFAEKGFNRATNREICERADANVAAINYYFGSKEKLYAEAWRKAFHDTLRAHPPDGGVPPDAPPEERLRGRISAMIHQAADADNPSLLIAHKEMADPTRLIEDVRKECVRPLRKELKKVVRELLGPDAPEKYVHFCQASIGAQCFGVLHHIRAHQSGNAPPPPAEEIINDIDGYAEHVYQFSLAGIRAMRAYLQEERA